jgi:hypothetical protein
MCNVIDFVENSTEFALGLVFSISSAAMGSFI